MKNWVVKTRKQQGKNTRRKERVYEEQDTQICQEERRKFLNPIRPASYPRNIHNNLVSNVQIRERFTGRQAPRQ
ncbi:unnamed protein product [Brassica oleracea]